MVSKFYSNAKINLALSINYQRPDSYHDISSIMQEINLYDIIEISKYNSNVINITSKGLKVPEDQSNLCYIAAKLFLEYYNIDSGVNITINKTIPIGAGLGGGSSNAATVIKGLSQLFDIPITKDIFYDLSSQIGADVFFFYNGGIQYVEGIGDKLTPLSPLLNGYYFLLVYPDIEISTPWAYNKYKKYLENHSNASKFVPLSDELDWSLLRNDFEKVVLSTYPEIMKIKNQLQDSGALFSSLSGSGSTMFGVYDNLESIRNISDSFNAYQTYEALPI
ncbi:MAG: 4-(cytidine 5'-diphospho)-2-C-methyl-D-erythritol kinase [Candidatus Marinimicrobia bacterium]|nr:4-(cytidine 5'-diphospho)-2-C-methyl-D-erythritol kinase [Candidatus Neomarinimicrobiota bacterium]|tara:strand:+ start:18919 stop:19752 length:834 start_codon:yes stop_codon:yes gene_type:complete